MAKIIVVTSGKGGVGKTTVTANLGFRLAALGKRVCIADADFGLNNLDVVTGVENLVVYDIVDCVEGKCRAKQALIQSPVNKNLYVLPSVHSFARAGVSVENLKELVDGLSPSFDYIFLDCPAGIDVGFRRAVSVCSQALVVTSDYHVARALALCRQEGIPATGKGSPSKPEYFLKNHLREGLSWVKLWAQTLLHTQEN